MYQSERFVAVSDGGHDDADSNQIVDARDIHIVLLEFFEQAIEVLAAAADFYERDAFFLEIFFVGIDSALDVLVAFVDIFFDDLFGDGVIFRIEVLEAQVFEFAFDFADAKAIGDRRVDLHCLAGDTFALFGSEVIKGAHIMQAVGQLDDDDADISRHCKEHLPQVFKEVFFAGATQFYLAKLSDTVHQFRHFDAEFFFDLIEGEIGVLGDIVQQTGRDSTRFHTDFRENPSGFEGVFDIVGAGFSFLPLMRFACHRKSIRDEFFSFTGKRELRCFENIFEGHKGVK